MQLTLASTYMADGKLDDADDLLILIAKQLDSQENRLPRGGASPLRSTWDACGGQWHLEKQQYSQAAVLLKRSVIEHPAAATKQQVAVLAQTYMQLGRCYTALKHWDQAASAFKEAATLLPQASRHNMPPPDPGSQRAVWMRRCGSSDKPLFAPTPPKRCGRL